MASHNKKKKKAAKPKKPRRRVAVKSKQKLVRAKKPAAKAKRQTKKPRARGKQEDVNSVSFEPKGLGPRSGGQSGDLQGLSNYARADAESVDELLEEGNAFEAEIVKGVEDARDADEGEVRTREVPEDDVPEEYLEE